MDDDKITYPDAQNDLTAKKTERRRKLLPWWIIAFIWLFLVFFAMMPIAVLMGLLNYDFEIFLLGVSTHQPFSLPGVFLISLFLFKGIIAFALWTEKEWAVRVAKIDAIISIAICFLVMAYVILVLQGFSIRLELIVLFFYNAKLNQIQYDWENFESAELTDDAGLAVAD